MKTKSAVAARPPLTCGSTALKKAPHCVQPSTIAASEISRGTSWKKLRISQTTNGNGDGAVEDRRDPTSVSQRPRYTHMKSSGMMIAIGGNMRSWRIWNGSIRPPARKRAMP